MIDFNFIGRLSECVNPQQTTPLLDRTDAEIDLLEMYFSLSDKDQNMAEAAAVNLLAQD